MLLLVVPAINAVLVLAPGQSRQALALELLAAAVVAVAVAAGSFDLRRPPV
jgi:hypothetical protein